MSNWRWHLESLPYGYRCSGCRQPLHTHDGAGRAQYGADIYAAQCLIDFLVRERDENFRRALGLPQSD